MTYACSSPRRRASTRSAARRVTIWTSTWRVGGGRDNNHERVRFDQRRFGIQQGLRAGEQFQCTPDAFATGAISGREVVCLSAEQQLRFDSGYEL